MTGRKLVTLGEAVSHPAVWFLTSLGQMLLLAGGVLSMLTSGLSLHVQGGILYFGLVLLCLLFAAFFFFEQLNGFRMYGIMGGILVYAVVLFFTQNIFLTGAKQFFNALILCINRQYESSLSVLQAGGDAWSLTVFLLEVLVIVVFWLGAAVVYQADIIWTALLIFPVMTILLLAGGNPSVLSLFFLLFGVLSLLASARSVRKKRLWGEKKSPRFQKNLICYKNIQKKTALFICVMGLLLSVPGFYIVRPGLSLQFAKAENVTAEIEGRVMNAVIQVLPKISAGKLNLRVETAGGGAADGALGDAEGYGLQNVEDLRLTNSEKPRETIYLKGYIGSGYTGDHWLEMDETVFKNAAANWKTEGDADLYIQNLSFLRNLYIEQNGGNELSGMQELKVERLNANSRYTYFPYHAFLNEYYEVSGGDGAVVGQYEQDDIFSYYPRAVYQAAIAEWNGDEEKKSVLDLVESSYGAYARANYLEVPDGFEKLQKLCEKQIKDKKIKKGDTEAVEEYIKEYLAKSTTFTMDAPALPEGEDFVKYFLYESKEGYSVHYASAATLMFRMFDVPARYVIGYAAPANLFSAQPDGSYTAVLQGDNAHAWTEIYVDQEGWSPVEMTPGALGTAEETEYLGEKVENQGTPEEEKGDSQNDVTEENIMQNLKEKWLNGNLETAIHMLAIVLSAGAILIYGIYFYKKRRKTLGLDRKKKPEERITDIFEAYYRELVKKGMLPETESTSEAFRAEVEKWNPSLKSERFEKMMALVLESCYGFAEKEEKDVEFMRKRYTELRKNIRKIK